MLLLLFLSLGLAYYSTQIQHIEYPQLLRNLKELTSTMNLDESARKRVNEMIIVNDDNYTYTVDKRVIHLYNGDANSMKIAAIHELAHVICDDIHHTKKFYEIENQLLQTALKCNLIHSTLISPEYPCVEHKQF
jgi:hypothetical protein